MKTIISTILLLVVLPLSAQKSIVVTHVIGKVTYYAPEGSRPRDIYAGLSLSENGRVQCGNNAKVKLLCKGKTFELNDTKMHYLDGIVKEASQMSSLSFAGRFWNFLTGSMEGTEDQQHLEEHHKKSMENLHAGIKGYATKDFLIQTNVIYEGKLSDAEVLFKWTSAESINSCFRLTRQSDDGVVLVAWTKANALHLNMSDLALEEGAQYEWQIITDEKDAAAPHSRKMQFTYQAQKASNALAAAKEQDAYKAASVVEQGLMEAYALEEQKFYFDASLLYAALAEKHADDMLAKRAYAAFLARVDKLDEASALIK